MLLVTYGALQIQAQDAMKIFSPAVSTIKFILLVFASGSGYAAVRLENVQGLVMAYIGITCVALLWIVLFFMAGLDSESTKLLRNMRRWSAGNDTSDIRGGGLVCGRMKWFRKGVNSLRPLQAGIFNLYVIRKPSLLFIVKIVLESVAFLLVNF